MLISFSPGIEAGMADRTVQVEGRRLAVSVAADVVPLDMSIAIFLSIEAPTAE
jgi:hypothetical protein